MGLALEQEVHKAEEGAPLHRRPCEHYPQRPWAAPHFLGTEDLVVASLWDPDPPCPNTRLWSVVAPYPAARPTVRIDAHGVGVHDGSDLAGTRHWERRNDLRIGKPLRSFWSHQKGKRAALNGSKLVNTSVESIYALHVNAIQSWVARLKCSFPSPFIIADPRRREDRYPIEKDSNSFFSRI